MNNITRCKQKQPLTLGSSETTREAPLNINSKNFMKFNDYWQYGQPEHIESTCINFLQWFIGFAEGDGSFVYCTTGRIQADFMIVQKDPKILFKIRQYLGFGKVYCINESQYWRYQATNKQNCQRLFHLFNGNLRLTKTQKRFESWAKLICPELIIKLPVNRITVDDAWLSGFIEADGGFYARLRLNKKFKLGKQFIKKFYITQKGEPEVLQQILNLFESCSKIQQLKVKSFKQVCISDVTSLSIQQKNASLFRIEISSFQSHQKIINYLNNFNLKGCKYISFKIWYRMHLYQVQQKHLTVIGLGRLNKLCQNLYKHYEVN